MTLTTIKKSNLASNLAILKGRLESEGITCYLKNEFTTQLMHYVPTCEVELQVLNSDLEQVEKIMSTMQV